MDHMRTMNERLHTNAFLWWQRAGVAGFAFFLVKGMLWLIVPWLLYALR